MFTPIETVQTVEQLSSQPANQVTEDEILDLNVDESTLAKVLNSDPGEEEEESEEEEEEEKTIRKIPLAQKLKNDPENPRIFWTAFGKVQKQIQREVNKVSNGEEDGEKATADLRQEILGTTSAIAEINRIESQQNPVVYTRLVRFANTTGLDYEEFEKRVQGYFTAIEQGQFSARGAAKPASITKLKEALSGLTPEQLVELSEEIKRQRSLLAV